MSDPVTDPALLAQLNAPSGPVTDPALLEQLNKPQTVRDLIHEVGRQAGLTVRAGVQGVAAIPAMLANAPATIYNKGADLVQGDGQGYRFPEQNTALSNALTAAGLPVPENKTERVAQAVTSGMTGAGASAKLGQVLSSAASPVVAAVGSKLAAGPGMQVASGGSGAASAELAKESGAGPVGQIIAGVAGGLAPTAMQAVGSAAIRGAVRGGEAGRKVMADRMQTFEDAGTTPSVGQATGNRAAQAFESGLSRAPGGAGPMIASAEKQSEDMGAKVNALADKLMPNATATKAGAKIEQGIKDFVQRFRGEQGFLYDKLDKYIPPDTIVPASNVQAAIQKLTTPIAGAEATSGLIQTPKMGAIGEALSADIAKSGGMPYQAIKELRTAIGAKITNPSLTDDISTGQWKQIYGALSEDMRAAAQQAGPEAEQAFNRANAYTAAGHNRIETYLDRVSGKDTVEKVFQAAANPSEIKEGASTINAVMRSLDPEQKKAVQAAFIKRMGLATAGNQNDLGEKFSAATFLTNWNKVSPEAKMTLFADGGGDLVANLNKIAAASNMIKDGSKVFANPSGTAQAISNQATTGGAVLAAATGHPVVAGGIVAAALGSNLAAKLMTNPDVVRWLAKTTEMPPSMIPAQLNVLSQIAKTQSAESKQAIMQFIQSQQTK